MSLLGGEPLLNRDINKFMEVSRKYFKDTYIYIVTNGILLDKMDASFWETACENNIWIGISPYPIKLDINLIKHLSKKYSVPCGFYQGYGIVDFGGLEDNRGKKMFRWAFDLQGKQNYKVNFMKCGYANGCITLKSGKLYTCAMAPHIEHFNKQFGEKLEITERDYIDIYKAKNIEEIMEFLATPIPFCRYCNLRKVTYNHEWSVTKKEISEWT
jgi:MoaA/NifB/PqqE/SkfB family radical SAM enzyme